MIFLSFAIIACFSAYAADDTGRLIEQATRKKATDECANPWCKVPCWTESCQSRYPDCLLSRHNREQERRFRESFPEGGPWDQKGCSGKKCCVQFLRNTSSCNTSIVATTAALPVALACAAYLVGGCGCLIGQRCCGACKDDCGIAGELMGKFICPGGYNPDEGFCCPPNVYTPLSWLADITCLSTPFCAACIDMKCIQCLSQDQADEYQVLQHVSDEDV